MQIIVEFSFPAAHLLPRYDGPCRNMHGHNYKLQVVVTGEPDDYSGMVIDFVDVKRIVQESVIARVDHSTLNDIMENPTAENLIIWMWDEIRPHLPGVTELRLWEQDDMYVTYAGPAS